MKKISYVDFSISLMSIILKPWFSKISHSELHFEILSKDMLSFTAADGEI